MATKHKDNADGARAAFEAITGQSVPEGAEVYPDPVVDGVWAIKGAFPGDPEPDAVVYLGGYKDPFGRTREHDDMEQCELVG